MGQKLERGGRFPWTSSVSSKSLCFCLWLMRIRASVCLCLSDCLRIIFICFDVYKCNVYSCKEKTHYNTEFQTMSIQQNSINKNKEMKLFFDHLDSHTVMEPLTVHHHYQQRTFVGPINEPVHIRSLFLSHTGLLTRFSNPLQLDNKQTLKVMQRTKQWGQLKRMKGLPLSDDLGKCLRPSSLTARASESCLIVT